MNPVVGWALAAAAVVVGGLSYGWQGVALALTAVVFWLLLQFGRVLRQMREAASRPLGAIDNAVMFNARLSAGMRMLDVTKLARSLGRKRGDAPETFEWTDGAGDRVVVELGRDGLVAAWRLERAAAPGGEGAGGQA